MIHRYLATTVGVLIIVMDRWRAGSSHAAARRRLAWWATATLLGVRPGPVRRAHGHAEAVPGDRHAAPARRHGACWRCWRCRPMPQPGRWCCRAHLRQGLFGADRAGAAADRLGGWVSTNYAVLACQGLPDLPGLVVAGDGFPPRLHAVAQIGETKHGDFPCPSRRCDGHPPPGAPMRLFAAIGLAGWGWALRRGGADAPHRFRAGAARDGRWQLLSGLSNVVLDWPCSRRWPTGGGAACSPRCAAAGARGRWRDRPRDAGSPSETMSETVSQTPPLPRPPPSRRQYYVLTKPRVVQLIVFCAVIGMLLAAPGLAALARARRHHRHLAGGRRRRGLQLPGSNSTSTRACAHRLAPTARGELTRTQTLLFSRCCAAPAACCSTWGQPADDVADARHLRRLCGDLHRGARR